MDTDRLAPEVSTESVVKGSAQMSAVTGKILGLLPVFILLLIIFLRIVFVLYKNSGQKTRNPQQRRQYMGSRARPSLPTGDPSIYVSPANLPPPPKYEAMAPPSYEEVVGVHYPSFQPQPITQPIAAAMAQSAPNTTDPAGSQPPTVLTVTNERATQSQSS